MTADVVPRIERVHELVDVEVEWDALAERSGGIFATALWNRLWWRHFGSDREQLLHAARADDGELVAVLPLYAWRARRPRVIRFLGHGPGDELGPTCLELERELAAGALHAVLDRLEWDVFFGEQLPGPFAWSTQLESCTWRREAAPSLRLPRAWDAYLETRSANFRQQLRRRERSLAGEGATSFRLAGAETLDRDLDTLFALHRARWQRGRTDFSDTPFHREVAHAADARGWLRLWLLELEGRPVAAWLGFHVGRVTSYYQAGRDPAFDRLSAGFVLLAHTIRAAIDDGATEYRFGRGDEAFKSRFTEEDPGLETIVLERGARGRAAVAAGRAARRLRAFLRRPGGWRENG